MTISNNYLQNQRTWIDWVKAALSMILLAGGVAFALNQSATTPLTVTQAPAPDFATMSADAAITASSQKLDLLETPGAADDRQALVEEIEKLLGVVAEKDAGNVQLLFLRGRLEKESGRNQNAITYLSKYVDTREGRTEAKAHRLLGDLFVEEFPMLARGHYNRAKALSPGDPAISYGLSQCALKGGDSAEALRLANDAVAADQRKNAKYVAQLTKVLISLRRWSEADNEAMEAMKIAQAEMRNNPGQRGPVESVYSQYELLIEIIEAKMGKGVRPTNMMNAPVAAAPTPITPDDYLKLAEYIGKRSEYAEMLAKHNVLAVLEQAAKATAPNVPLRIAEQRAIALAEVGRKPAAVAAFETIIKADPENKRSKEWLEKLKGETP